MTAAATPRPVPAPTALSHPRPLFQPFNWVITTRAEELGARDHVAAMEFAARTRDVVRGMSVVLQLLEHVGHDKAGGDPPLLDDVAANDLLRLAAVAGNLLDNEIDGHIERLERGVVQMQAQVTAAAAPPPGAATAPRAAGSSDRRRADHARG